MLKRHALLMILFMQLCTCEATTCTTHDDCPRADQFCSGNLYVCENCSRCPDDVLDGTSSLYSSISECRLRGNPKPYRCALSTCLQEFDDVATCARPVTTTPQPTPEKLPDTTQSSIITQQDPITGMTGKASITPTMPEILSEATENATQKDPVTQMPSESKSPKVPNWIIWMIAVLGGLIIIGFVVACLYGVRQRRFFHSGGYTDRLTDVEMNLIDNRITMTNSDFSSGTICGLDVLWREYSCVGVIVKQKKTTVATVTDSDHPHNSALPISDLTWKDAVKIFILCRGCRTIPRLIKKLKMNCLKVPDSEVKMTSAVILCPKEESRTFYMRFGPKSNEDAVRTGDPELITTGRKEIRDLRPSQLYLVELGTVVRPGDISWQWRKEFTTKSPICQSIIPTEQSATVRWSEEIPETMNLYIGVNSLTDEKLERVVGREFQCKDLIPGMEQFIQLKIQDDEQFVPLHEETFCTEGCVPEGGEYKGDVTTDCDEIDQTPSRVNRRQCGGQRSRGPLQCTTSLLKAIHTMQRNGSIDQQAWEIIVERLKQLFRKKYKKNPKKEHSKGKKCLMDVEEVLRRYDLQDTCSLFDVMQRFVVNKDRMTEQGISLAKELHAAHGDADCQACDHANFILEVRRQELSQSSPI